MMRFPRLSSVLAPVLALGVLLSGCGGAQSTPKPATEPPQTQNKLVELNFYYPIAVSGPLKPMVDKMVADFNKANDGKIKVTASFAGNYTDTLTKAQASPPDVGVLLSTDTYTLVDADLVVPLDDLAKADKDGDAYMKDFLPAFMSNSQVGGKTYGVPFQRSTPVLYYNKDMFKAAGLTEDMPKNWDEMVAAAKATTKDGVWGIEIPSDGLPYWTMQGFMIANGKNLMNAAGTETYFNAPEVVQALQDLLDLSKVHKVEPTGVVPWANVPTDFASGKTAMAIHSSGSLANVLKTAKFNVGLGFIPGRKGFGAPTGGGNIMIFKAASPEKRAAAWKLIRFLTEADRAAQWSVDTGYVPGSKAAFNSKVFQDAIAKNPQYAVAYNQLQYAQAELMTHQNAQIYDVFNKRLQAIVSGQMDPKSAMDAAQADADKLLKPFRK